MENSEVVAKLEILRKFLDTADFQKLRVISEMQLLEGKKVYFRIYINNGISVWEMNVN